MQIRFSSIMLIVAALIASNCQSPRAGRADDARSSSALPPETNATLPPEQVTEARHLYLNKCARCHKFYNPGVYSEAEWQTWMHKMSRKAKLTPAQEDLLAKYLETFREPRGPSP